MIMLKEKCKLMFFVYILGQGGAERVILNILNNIDLKKYDIHLTLGVKDGNEYLPFLERKDKIHIHYLDVPLGHNEEASSKLAEYLDKFNIDILFTEAYFTNTLAYHASKKAKNKVKLIFREATCRSKTQLHTLKDILNTAFRYNFCAKKVIAISDGVKNDLKRSYFVFDKKIVRIYNPIDIDRVVSSSLEKMTDKKFLSIEGKKIINVARLAPAKDQKVLIDAFKILTEKSKQKLALIFCGKGDLGQELKDYCKKQKIKNVHFIGFQENPHKYIKNSDVFVLSSKSEGFGNVITEAMAIGTPVVSTDYMSGPREILKDGKFGLLVEVGNSEQMATAIEKVLMEKELQKNLIEKAKKEVANYRIQNIVKQYESVIDEVFQK